MEINPLKEDYLRAWEQYYPMTSGQFYEKHIDLSAFDNGKGLFVLANNRNVTLSELTEYGRKTLSIHNKPQALLKAAEELASRLRQKPRPFAQYYLNEVLDQDAAALVLASGALYLFDGFEEGIGWIKRPPPPEIDPYDPYNPHVRRFL